MGVNLELVKFLRDNEDLVHAACDCAYRESFGWSGNCWGLSVVLFIDRDDFKFSTEVFGSSDCIAPWSSRVELKRFSCSDCSGNCDNCEDGGCELFDTSGSDFCDLDQICDGLTSVY